MFFTVLFLIVVALVSFVWLFLKVNTPTVVVGRDSNGKKTLLAKVGFIIFIDQSSSPLQLYCCSYNNNHFLHFEFSSV
jgi:hypothetical protein